MKTIKIKICGITKPEDAALAAKLEAWAVGFIFVKESPRYIEPQEVKSIISSLPQNIEKIGVFANSSLEEVIDVASESGITGIQLHGDESAEFCAGLSDSINILVIRAIRVRDFGDLEIIPAYKGIVSAILLDTYSESQLGGTGETFNWEIAKAAKLYDIPIILAGGLNPENIKEAFRQVQPYALDISSGVEKGKGIKDHNKLIDLFNVLG